MNKTTPFKKGFALAAFLSVGSIQNAYAQTKFFRSLSQKEKTEKLRSAPTQNINTFSVVELNEASLKSFLSTAPSNKGSVPSGISLDIPMPNGTIETFHIYEASVLTPELQALHPEIRTYEGQGTQHSGYKITFSLTSIGFSAIMTGIGGDTVMIEKVKNISGNLYKIYFSKDAVFPESLHSGSRCQSISQNHQGASFNGASAKFTNGSQIKTFRIAIAATGEFTSREGSQAAAYAKIVQYVTELNAIYKPELGVQLTLVSNTNVVYTDAATDPYTNNNQSNMLTENRTNLNAVLGNSGYDVGHVFGTEGGSGGGVAYFQSVCNDTYKGGGVSGIGDEQYYAHVFSTQLVAHEVGHQFGMSHSYNSNIPVCTTRNYSTSVEPGSGATIMSYGFTCANSNPGNGVTGNDDYHNNWSGGVLVGPFLNFHVKSLEQSLGFIAGLSCNTSAPSANSVPVITTMQTAYTIPKSTPFWLKGTATDSDNDPLSYSWEGTNLSSMPDNPDGTKPSALDGSVLANTELPPFFRSYPPVSSGTEPGLRYYPLLSAILNGSNYAKGDKLPSVAYATTHTLSVRDSNGGLATEDVTVNIDNSGPFLITNDFTGTHIVGSNSNVTWSVNGTDTAPVNCTLVDIWFSADGGQTFTTQLASAVPNNGTASVTMPNLVTNQARIKITPSSNTASGNTPNIFFDISNSDFTIEGAPTIWTFNGTTTEWTNGVPTSTISAIINADYNGVAFEAKSLTVNSGKKLTVIDYVKTGNVQNNGTIEVANGANFIQTVNGPGTFTAGAGSKFAVRADTKPVKRLAYVAWSSPLNVSSQTLKAFSYGRQIDGVTNQSGTGTLDNRFYNWLGTTYFEIPSSDSFVSGKGFQIRIPNDFTTTAQTFHGYFEGTEPNNGNITIDGGTTNSYPYWDEHIFLGNPYPGALDINSFLAANPNPTAFPNGRTVYIWNSEVESVNNSFSGTLYHTYTSAGSNPNGAINGKIAAGQGFFIDKAAGEVVFVFNNAMRGITGGLFNKTTSSMNRFWLELKAGTTGVTSQLLLAFHQQSSAGVDVGWDAKIFQMTQDIIYTTVDNQNFTTDVHGDFLDSDKFFVNVNTSVAGNYTISLTAKDGIFNNGQKVYIKDNATGITGDLSQGTFSFVSNGGIEPNRFEVFFMNNTVLGIQDMETKDLEIYGKNSIVYVKAKQNIKSIKIFDLSGRVIKTIDNINKNIIGVPVSNAKIILVSTELTNGKLISKKIKL